MLNYEYILLMQEHRVKITVQLALLVNSVPVKVLWELPAIVMLAITVRVELRPQSSTKLNLVIMHPKELLIKLNVIVVSLFLA